MSRKQAIYKQLMDTIKNEILSGELTIGDKLDSERAMSSSYGINRMTVKNALKHLEEEGIVETKHGKGTYVISIPKMDERIELGTDENISLSMQIRQTGLKSDRRVLSVKKIIPADAVKEHFPTEKYVYEIIRLSLINNHPYAIQKAYIPGSIFADAERFDFENFSLYDYMEDQQHRPVSMTSYLRMSHLPLEYTEMMGIDSSKYVFLFDYLGFDHNNQLVEYTISYHHPEYTSFKVTSNVDSRDVAVSGEMF